MSRRLLPKQFLPLASEATLFQGAVERFSSISGGEGCIVVCSEEHRFLVAEQLREIGSGRQRIMLEPAPRGTAAAIALAAFSALETDKDAVLFVTPSDLLIQGESAFDEAAQVAVSLAQDGHLVTFGIKPDFPSTGYGYIEKGTSLRHESAFTVSRFVEKPDLQRAQSFLGGGRHFWNSGMFVLRAQDFLEELSRYRPDLRDAIQQAWESRTTDADFIRPDKASFLDCPSDSIDYAVMERTSRAAMVEAGFAWNDVGSWSALWDVAAKNEEGNVIIGDVDAHATTGSYLRAESRMLSVSGLEKIVVVETADAVLVTRMDLSQQVKDVVARLEKQQRTEHLSHRRVYRPWGYYESLDAAPRYQVKRLMVKPRQALSLQFHRHRAEHWVVVSGTAEVTRGDSTVALGPNESTYIPIGMHHRLANVGNEPLFVIEVQSGDYLGEDDIVRLEDRYARD
jgi:mannose-1-phosphate guanylyltransferase/mannose-6-phosphate isomerase